MASRSLSFVLRFWNFRKNPVFLGLETFEGCNIKFSSRNGRNNRMCNIDLRWISSSERAHTMMFNCSLASHPSLSRLRKSSVHCDRNTILINTRLLHTANAVAQSCKENHAYADGRCCTDRHCWKCGRKTSSSSELFFCDCGVVQQPPDGLTYFDLMSFEPTFDIDVKKLGNIYRETQKRLHPDMYSTKSETERELAEHQSSLLNKAYFTLLKPLSRAIYLLELHGIYITESDNFSDPLFLMEILEVNEQISSASEPAEFEAIESSNDKNIRQSISHLSDLFKNSQISEAREVTIKLRYYTTIQERLNELKRDRLG